MRISDWSSDVCSADLTFCPSAGRQSASRSPRMAANGGGAAATVDLTAKTANFWFSTSVASWPSPSVPWKACATIGASSARSEEHTSELQTLMRISYAVFCLKKKKTQQQPKHKIHT